MLAAKGNLTGAIYHYEEALVQLPKHKMALSALRSAKCYVKFHQAAQSEVPVVVETPTTPSSCPGKGKNECKVDNTIMCKHVSPIFLGLGQMKYHWKGLGQSKSF